MVAIICASRKCRPEALKVPTNMLFNRAPIVAMKAKRGRVCAWARWLSKV